MARGSWGLVRVGKGDGDDDHDDGGHDGLLWIYSGMREVGATFGR